MALQRAVDKAQRGCRCAETAASDGFVIRPETYYHDAWETFIEAGLAQPLIAEVKGKAVTLVITFRFHGKEVLI
jgi:peptidoglycan pentaglycine glycine transferase (the first glycine)